MSKTYPGRAGFGLALAVLVSAPGNADPVACPDSRFQTLGADDVAGQICEIATRTAAQLATCNLDVEGPVLFELVDMLPDECLGIFHCGDQRIEIEHPDAYTTRLAHGRSGAFSPVSPEAFFESVIRHELAHVALQSLPCPFDHCIVGQEYIAYTMQVRFMPAADIAAFEAVDPVDGPVSRDTLNPIILMMAPDLFARRAWQHLTERDEPCAFIGQIASAQVLLDYERP
ncbi:hypothetical protein A8B78_06330 [Jannaschia sp. EhC01]|nr:hypothetical protein A8B78_06330 [Jannaschia sp. EhC01]